MAVRQIVSRKKFEEQGRDVYAPTGERNMVHHSYCLLTVGAIQLRRRSPVMDKKLYDLMQIGQTREWKLWVTEFARGKRDRILPGYSIQPGFGGTDYPVSKDGKQVAFERKMPRRFLICGLARQTTRSALARFGLQKTKILYSFLPNGDLIFRAGEGNLNFVYRMKQDGTARSKVVVDPIFDLRSVSLDGRWVVAHAAVLRRSHFPLGAAFPVRLLELWLEPNFSKAIRAVSQFSRRETRRSAHPSTRTRRGARDETSVGFGSRKNGSSALLRLSGGSIPCVPLSASAEQRRRTCFARRPSWIIKGNHQWINGQNLA